MMRDWKQSLDQWRRQYRCRVLPPPSAEDVAAAEAAVGDLPGDLRELYKNCNGLDCDSITVLPIEAPSDPKRTWNGLIRNNDLSKTLHLGRDQALLRRFLVFGVMSPNQVAVIDRGDGTIWFEEDGELHQSETTIMEFIDLVLREG